MTDKEMILRALSAFIAQRPGMDPRNYGDLTSYRAESRQVTKDRHDAETLLRFVDLRDSITAEYLAEEMTERGRLSLQWREKDGKRAVAIDYTTGQYFPTEYRKAVCRALVSVIWRWLREDCACDTGDKIRAAARRNLGSKLAARWFN